MAMHDDDEIEHIFLEDEAKRPEPQHHSGLARAVDNEEERQKFRRILIGITLVAAMLTFVRGVELQRFIADFMAVFCIAFAALKFADLEAFVHAYRSVDYVAKQIRPWGYIFPFIEAFMGFWYLLSSAPNRLNIFALIVTGLALIGVVQTWQHKPKIQYTYNSTLLRLPIAAISRIEIVTLFVLAAVSLFV